MYHLFSSLLFLAMTFPQFCSTAPTQPNVLIYGDGNVQVNSSINQYANVDAGVPLQGSIMITHDSNNPVDKNSFKLGDQPLKTRFLQTTNLSATSNLVVDVYSFEVDNLKKGLNVLPSIKVIVGGKEYQAAPLTIPISR